MRKSRTTWKPKYASYSYIVLQYVRDNARSIITRKLFQPAYIGGEEHSESALVHRTAHERDKLPIPIRI